MPPALPLRVELPSPRLHVRVGCQFDFEASGPTPLVAQILPHPDDPQTIAWARLRLEPDVPVHEYRDGFNNRCLRLVVPEGGVTLRWDALLEISAEPDPIRTDAWQTGVEGLPDETLSFTLPSRYVESDKLANEAWELFGGTPTGWARVQAICDWIHTRIQYRAASTTPRTTALDVFLQRYGVCRDFAHLGVAMCRAVNIPARYVFGYLGDIRIDPTPGLMDFHSWFEAWLGDRWHTFDARHNHPRIGRVPIGRGRDAADVALVTQYGPAQLVRMEVWSDEVSGDTPPPDA
jgi:transglutaminase-like putative cysteine protease